MGVGGQRHALAALPPGKTQYPKFSLGGWMGPRACMDGCGKFRPPPGFDPRTVQPIASRSTDSYPCPGVTVDSLNSLVACDIQSVTVNAASQSSGRRKQFEHCIGIF